MHKAAYDCVVVGLGGVGSAALYHLARSGQKVLGLEAFGIAHEYGSSHGATRIIRGAYHEGASYVPLLKRAWQLFHELQEETGTSCIHQTGCLDVGAAFVSAAKASCDAHNVDYTILTGEDVKKRYPGYQFGNEQVLHSPLGGIVESENAIRAHVAAAESHGAEVKLHTRVLSWEQSVGTVRIHTEAGETIETKSAVFAAGCWMPQLIPELLGYLQPERQVVAWFEVDETVSALPCATHPVWIMAHKNGGDYYGFPQFGEQKGFKIGRLHHLREKTDPDTVRREVDEADIAILREVVADCFPSANGEVLKSSTCLFTNTPDEHFLLDLHPKSPNVVMVSACSGHGFKFTSVLGEVAKDLVMHGETSLNIDLFKMKEERLGMADVLNRFHN